MSEQQPNNQLHMLTTIDNPFNPFTSFDDWFAFDEEQGYHSCALLARTVSDADNLSDEQKNRLAELAIDEIVDNDLQNLYIKVTKDFKVRVLQKSDIK